MHRGELSRAVHQKVLDKSTDFPQVLVLDAGRFAAYTARMIDTPDDALQRKLAFEALHNFRDFGGYAAGGRSMATGRFFRSANHALASDSDLDRLARMNIGAVIDLRRPEERVRQPSRRWAGFAARVIENDDPGEGQQSWTEFMAGWDMTRESFRAYILRYYEEAPHLPRLVDLYTRYFEALAEADGAVVVHCAAGKDRTGLVVALTHELAGVHRDDIVADYLLTNDSERFAVFGAQWAETIRQERGVGPTLEVMQYVMGVQAEYLERSFAVIKAQSGGVERYLRDVLGVDAAKRAAIERRLFE
jgi:protein-tyrosine phosphatase